MTQMHFDQGQSVLIKDSVKRASSWIRKKLSYGDGEIDPRFRQQMITALFSMVSCIEHRSGVCCLHMNSRSRSKNPGLFVKLLGLFWTPQCCQGGGIFCGECPVIFELLFP